MKRQKRYWNGVVIMTGILCLATALAYCIVPGVRGGAVPPIGGIIWHALGPLQLLIANVFRPFAYAIAPASSPWLRSVILLLMTCGSILLISMVICLPLCFPRQRPRVNAEVEETSARS
ncbi:MAG: hypothetical protein ACYSWQ_14775 [Planctomycetota bacterium]|jgi:hypothetical protein